MPRTETDFAKIRAKVFDKDFRPTEWPDGVFAVSIDGLSLLGVHEKTNRLYWDGKEIVTRSIIRLGKLETWLAVFGAAGAFGTFAVDFANLGHTLNWWGAY